MVEHSWAVLPSSRAPKQPCSQIPSETKMSLRKFVGRHGDLALKHRDPNCILMLFASLPNHISSQSHMLCQHLMHRRRQMSAIRLPFDIPPSFMFESFGMFLLDLLGSTLTVYAKGVGFARARPTHMCEFGGISIPFIFDFSWLASRCINRSGTRLAIATCILGAVFWVEFS